MPRACAYCRKDDVVLTKEHVLNDALAQGGSYVSIDTERRSPPSRRPPQTKDVCRICNNERLAWLDRYGAALAKKYFKTPVVTPIDVKFEYDYARLVGWLVKCAYNHARFQHMEPGA